MAVALVYARTGTASYRTKAANAIMSIIGTEGNARSLALGRNIASYVIAAELINLGNYDSAKDQQFRTWLRAILRRVNSEGRSIITCHEERPNNWGTMCGASRIASDIYLGDKTDLARAATVFHGWSGDRSAYAGFDFGDVNSWTCDTANLRAVNPVGCTKEGHDLSGAPIDDVRRGGSYKWPPAATNYAWGGLSAAIAQAEMLHRAGYPAYEWEQRAMFRGMEFVTKNMASSQSGSTEWLSWLANYRYGTNYPTKTPVAWGRLMHWTDWTHKR